MILRNILVYYVYGQLCNTATGLNDKCQGHDFSNSLLGLYCPNDGILIPNLSWHQCKLFCMHNQGCQAVNYNFTNNLCTHMTKTCPLAVRHPDMAFATFTSRQRDHCIEWIPNRNEIGQPAGERLLTADHVRYAARIKKDGNDLIGYMLWSVHHCYASSDVGTIKSKRSGDPPCQYLKVRDNCTVLYQHYELGTLLPLHALVGGYIGGLPVYLGRKRQWQTPMSYIPGSNRWALGFSPANGDAELLVVL